MTDLPPSSKRRKAARERGEVAVSPVLTRAGAIAGGGLLLWATGAGGAARVLALAERAFTGQLAATEAALPGAATELAVALARVALPVAAGAWVGALVAGALQSRALFNFGAFERRSREPADELPSVPWALAAALVMLAIVTARTVGAALGRATGIEGAGGVVLEALAGLAPRAVLLLGAAGLGDLAWRRARQERSLWMTRGERERERRDEGGDPRVAAERRRRHRSVL